MTDNVAASRLELEADGELAQLSYRRRAGRLVLIHTAVPGALSGQGIGGKLVRAAIDKAAGENLTLVPLCPFARDWLQRHSEEASRAAIDWASPDR